MHRHGPPWKSKHGPQWWPEEEQWPPRLRNERETFESFGRQMFRAVLFGAALLFLVAAAIGAIIATGLSGVAPNVRWTTVLITVAVLLLAARVLRGIARRTWSPVRALIDAAGRLADGDYTSRADVRGRGTISEVASSFNEMAERLEHSDEQRRRLMADLGHELRTPLAIIRGEVEAVIDGVRPGGPEQMTSLLDEVETLERLIDDLRLITLSDAGRLELQLEEASLGDIVEELASSYLPTAEASGVKIQVSGVGSAPDLDLDVVRIRQALTNLVVNALRSMNDGGVLRIALRAGEGRVSVDVEDTGSGIDPEQLPEVFDRFSKSDRSPGSGLGLSIARGIMRAHRGDVEIISTGPSGTKVTAWFPVH